MRRSGRIQHEDKQPKPKWNTEFSPSWANQASVDFWSYPLLCEKLFSQRAEFSQQRTVWRPACIRLHNRDWCALAWFLVIVRPLPVGWWMSCLRAGGSRWLSGGVGPGSPSICHAPRPLFSMTMSKSSFDSNNAEGITGVAWLSSILPPCELAWLDSKGRGWLKCCHAHFSLWAPVLLFHQYLMT